jgi:hypothetical protein
MTMNRNNPQSLGSDASATSRAHVAYDRATGRIVHVHHTVSFGEDSSGGETPEARTRRIAARKVAADLEVIEVNPSEVDHPGPIRIDLATRKVAPA